MLKSYNYSFRPNQSFTLIELITVVIIIGILVAIAVPQYNITVERSRSAEGVGILNALRQAQLRYAMENNGQYTYDYDKLDVEIPFPRFFLDDVGLNSSGEAGVERDPEVQYSFADPYSLLITSNGNIVCQGDGCENLCTKLGFTYSSGSGGGGGELVSNPLD